MDYCSHQNSSFESSPERLLESLENYLHVNKGFRRTNARHLYETRALYLNSALTHRSGSTATREIAQVQSIVFRSFLLMFLSVIGKERDRSLLLFTLLDVIS